MSVLQSLIGQTVASLERGNDSLHLGLDEGAALHVFNRYEISGGALENLVGATVQSVSERAEAVVFAFSLGVTLSVGLADADYSGPECMQLVQPGEPIVVWN
jgi:hypothetical protein